MENSSRFRLRLTYLLFVVNKPHSLQLLGNRRATAPLLSSRRDLLCFPLDCQKGERWYCAAKELLPASLVGLKKCSSLDISLQSPRYVSPKTRYEAAKRLPRVEVAKGACYAMQCLCIAMYKRHPQMGNMLANYRFANITSFAKFTLYGSGIRKLAAVTGHIIIAKN